MTKQNVFIRSDKKTIEGLKRVADGKPVAQLLREIAGGQVTAPVPIDALESLRASMIKQFETFREKTLEFQEKILDELDDISQELEMINQAMRSNPKLAKELDKAIERRVKDAQWANEVGQLQNRVVSLIGESKFEKLISSLWSTYDDTLLKELIANPALIDDRRWLQRQRNRLNKDGLLFGARKNIPEPPFNEE